MKPRKKAAPFFICFSVLLLSAHAVAPAANAAFPEAAAGGKSLAECYQAALKRSEKVAVQDELLIQANELSRQAIGSSLPNVSGSAAYLRQQASPGSSGSNAFPEEQSTVKITAIQPLFQGFREFAAIRQRKTQAEAQKFFLQNAAKQLFYDTASAYYNVLALQADERNFEIEIDVNRKRLQELQGFMRIGRSRASEGLTQRSNISSLEAKLEATRGQLENAKEVLAFLTGLDRDAPLRDEDVVPTKLGPVSKYLGTIEQRPDVKIAAANVKAFDEGLPLARGQHLPAINLMGDYYFKRPGAQKDSKWDVQIEATLNLFAGGSIQSQVRQAASALRQQELLLSEARRTAEQEIRRFHDSFSSDLRQVEKLGETAELAEKTYQAELREYRNGLVTNLDVLQAITTWRDAQRALEHQQQTLKEDYAKLQAATAQRKEIFIESKKAD